MAANFSVNWNEDSSATVLGRITARNGSGSATGVDGEGNWLQIADISTITCAVYDLDDSDTPNTAIATPTVTISSAVLDTPVTTAVLWTKDSTGYNFIYDLLPAHFPTGNNRYEVEFTITLAGDIVVFHGTYQGVALPVRVS